MTENGPKRPRNFIQEIIDADVQAGKWGPPGETSVVRTRFPPEPNGYLHIGHAKSICLNFGLAAEYGGQCNLRFDDTNPVREEQEYVDGIIHDVRWLGFRWPGAREDDSRAGVLFASDYFEQMYAYAVELIRKGKAYVCDLSPEQIREYRGTLTEPGRNSPCRDRSVEENLELFERMRRGEFPDGSKTLRAKIDMAHPNLNMRDPVMYRVLHARHHRTGDRWCIYPTYDWAHGLEDSIEGITHSICTLEFENHRPLYDWFLDAINEGRTDDGSGPWGRKIPHPQQIEFARLNLSYTVMSKRKLLELVRGGYVRGWDDPRMPTICGLRRRGYTPESIREFCARIGVAKFEGVSDVALLEHCVRNHLNHVAPRVMAVLRPLRVVITNWPEGQVEWLEAINNPEDPAAGTRKVPFSRVLHIERDDFMEDPPRKFYRLAPGREVRLRYAYFVRCHEVVKDPQTGEVIELHCTYDPATRGGDAPDGRKVKATLHWVSAAHAIDCEVRLYDRLFNWPDPDRASDSQDGSDQSRDRQGAVESDARGIGQHVSRRTGDPADSNGQSAQGRPAWLACLNPDSLQVLTGCKLEPNWRDSADTVTWPDGIRRVQFERLGYFCVDPDSTDEHLVFNRTVTLKDTWAKIAGRGRCGG